MTTLMSIADFRAAAKGGKRPDGAVFRLATGDAEIAEDTRVARFTFSDDSIDRMGDRIMQDGWDLADFKANPVALWAHDSSSPPVGRSPNVGVTNGKLVGDIEFADAETYAFADTIFRLVKGKFVRAVSVGFMPTDYKFVETRERFGIDFLKQQLLEISICPIPANPNALQEAKRLGIDISPLREWAEKLLDTGDCVMIPRDVLEGVFKDAKTPKTLRQKYLAPKAKEESAASTVDTPTADEDVMPAGNCGMTKDEACGMKDQQHCAIHYTPPEAKTIKSGRRISAATKALIDAATEHLVAMGGYHVKAMDCLKAVGDGGDDDDDKPDGASAPDKAMAKRLAAARALKAELKIE